MELATASAARAYQAAYDMEPSPRFIQTRIADFYKRSVGGEYPLLRQRTELLMANKLESRISANDRAIYKLNEERTAQHINLQADAANSQYKKNADSKNRDAINEKLEDIAKQVAMLRGENSPLQQQLHAINARQSSCNKTVLSAIAGSPLVFIEPPIVDKKITLKIALDQIGTIKAKLVEIEQAPHLRAKALADAKAWNDARAVPINYAGLLRPGGQVVVPMIILPGSAGTNVESINMLGIDIAKDREKYDRMAQEQIDREHRDEEALSPEARATKTAESKMELLDWERIYETIAWEHHLKNGETIDLRADSNPLAILSASAP